MFYRYSPGNFPKRTLTDRRTRHRPCPQPYRSKNLRENIKYLQCETNDTWARDHSGITLIQPETGQTRILDFAFNGWGLKFAANFDNLITSRINENKLFNGEYVNRLNFVLEGGSIESDGKGTLLTTSECLLSPNRNGEWDKKQIESYLKEKLLGATSIMARPRIPVGR